MNQKQWLAGTDPEAMVAYLYDQGHDRKLRLFGCACARQVWDMVKGKPFRQAVETAERFADGRADKKELEAARLAAGRMLYQRSDAGVQGEAYCALSAATATTSGSGTAAMTPLWVLDTQKQRIWQIALLHEIFGNPFKMPKMKAKWRTEQVLTLAGEIYDGRDFSRMSKLSAALRKAGCDNEAILSHFRKRRHVPGCWVLDLILDQA